LKQINELEISYYNERYENNNDQFKSETQKVSNLSEEISTVVSSLNSTIDRLQNNGNVTPTLNQSRNSLNKLKRMDSLIVAPKLVNTNKY
jgi:hypothetical protein